MRNKVFISYRHESIVHAAAVRRLGILLREAHIPVELDQFFLDDHPGGPDEGWPKWCEDCANESKCVLIIASEGWFAAYEKTGEPGSGLGAATEADLFRQALWDDKGHNTRIRLTFLHQAAADKIPVRLRAWHSFRPFDTPEQLNQLVRWLGGCLNIEGVEPPTVLWPLRVRFEPDIADRNKKEWPAVVDLLAGHSRERILLIEGRSGVGKSELIRQANIYARKVGIPVAQVNFKGGTLDVEAVLGSLSLELSGYLPNFSREGSNKTYLLRKDLRALRQPVLVVFDHYEDAVDNKLVVDWLNVHLLGEVETSLSLAVIVAGQVVPQPAHCSWCDLSRHLLLEPITDLDAWKEWISRRYPDFQDKGDLRTLLKATKGSPLLMATLCANVAKA